MKLSFFKRALVGTLLVTGMPAMAGMEVQPLNFGSQSSPIDIGAADMPALQFSKFDPSLGTLDDIVITLTANNSMDTSVVNLGQATSYQGLYAAATITIFGQVGADNVQAFSSLSVGPTHGSIAAGSYSAPITVRPAQSSTPVPAVVGTVNPTDFSTFEGGGTLDFLLNASLSNINDPNSNVPLLYYGFDAYSYGTVDIEYDYTTPLVAVPETGTMMAGLFALGIGFIVVCRARVRYQ